jgi:hypothetical protein
MCSTVSGAGPPSTEQECESEPVFSHPNVAPVAAPRAAPHAAPPAVRLELLHRVGVRDVTEVHAVDPTGRPLGVTPDVTLLLNQRDLAASIQNGERGGQTRQAAANHDHVRWMILLTGSIDEGPGCHRTKRVLRELGRVPDAVVPGEDQDPRVGGE